MIDIYGICGVQRHKWHENWYSSFPSSWDDKHLSSSFETKYGLVVVTDEGADGWAFATVRNVGQFCFTTDKALSVTVNRSVLDPIKINYPMGNTTINLWNMVKLDKKRLHWN